MPPHADKIITHNSWIILSKLMTANRREAIAAPEMRASAIMRSREAVFFTVEEGTLRGTGYAKDIVFWRWPQLETTKR
jgi:hypothetical protein